MAFVEDDADYSQPNVTLLSPTGLTRKPNCSCITVQVVGITEVNFGSCRNVLSVDSKKFSIHGGNHHWPFHCLWSRM